MTAAIRALRDAVGRVGRRYERISEPKPPIVGAAWESLEREIDRAIALGNESLALGAIAAWERHAEELLGPRLLNAPLGERP